MCAGFPDLSTLLFHFLSPVRGSCKLLHCPSVDAYRAAWLPTQITANTGEREEKKKGKAETTEGKNQIVHSNQIDLQYYWNTNRQRQVCTNAAEHRH